MSGVVQRLVLNVVFILFLARQSKFCALVQLVSVTFARDVHHDQVFATDVEFCVLSLWLSFRVDLHWVVLIRSVDRNSCLVSIDRSLGTSMDRLGLLPLHGLSNAILALQCLRVDIRCHGKVLLFNFLVSYYGCLHALVVRHRGNVVL